METIKNAIGLNTPAQQSGQEPVNAEQGAGTVIEPYDGGNKDENTPAVLDAAASTSPNVNAEGKAVERTNAVDGATPTTVPGASPAAAAIVSDGAEPANTTDTSAEATKDAVAPSKAVGASTTKTVGELGDTSATTDGVKSGEPTATTDGVEKAEPTATTPSAQKDKTIGSAGWFKNTLQRRKSKGNPLQNDSEKGPKVPEKDHPPKKSASVGFIEPTKQKETPVVESKDKEKTGAGKEKKHKRGKSVSETLKSANPFKRRQSKAEQAESKANKDTPVSEEPIKESKHEELTALPVVPGHESTATSGVVAPVVEDKKTVDAKAPAAEASPAVATTAPVSRYADEEIAPDEIPGVAARKDETVAETKGLAAAEGSNSTPAALAAAAAASTPILKSEPVDAGSSTVKESSPEDAKVTSPAATTPAATTPATSKPVDEPSAVPTIKEPPAEASGSGKSAVVDDKPQTASTKNENLSAIPTAGGIRLGTKAMEERRASIDTRRKSFVPEDVKSTEAAVEPSHDTPAPEKTEIAETNHAAKDGAPTRRLSVFGKLKGKLKN